ncbi:hypothetical protein [Bacterioplanoides sp.]|uniref:hypothetical protein n=1 Tax=Bacterioplanoides sp. TaxID=2066072 RepID=UPI003B591859
MNTTFIVCLMLLVGLGISSHSVAELKPLNDAFLAEMTGQSAIKIDEIPIDFNDMSGVRLDGSDKDLSFTRITLGADVDLNANIDRTVIGRRPRPASEVEMPELEADVILNNLSLGRIMADDQGNPIMENFSVRDPYIEIARNADNELIGLRLGFKEANGVVSHDIVALSGDITAKAFVDEIIGLPIGGLNLTEFPYNNASRTNRISTELQLLGGLSPTLTLFLGRLGRTELQDSRNLYLGFQSQAINYPKVGPGPQGTAKPGFWLNLQDGLSAPELSITGNLSQGLISENDRANNVFSPYTQWGRP